MADVHRIHRVADRVVATVAEGHQVVVAVSAMGNTTSELLALAQSVSPHPKRRELDLLISVGERVSMTLLAMAIQDRGVNAASFTGSQSGIITDENHVSAQVLEVRPDRIRDAITSGNVAIVAGFQGMSRSREVTTLGRGGTDTTAVVLTAALGADYCEICSDVDGVYSADPRVVPNAQKINVLPLDAAISMSRAGARVLLVDALEYARTHNITLHANATRSPVGQGTHLPPGETPSDIVAIASDKNLESFSISNLDEIPASLKGATRHWFSTSSGMTVLVDTQNLHDRSCLPASWVPQGPIATVSVIGRSVVRDPAMVHAAWAAARGPRDWWATADTWTAVVTPRESDAISRDLHRSLIELKP